MANGKRKGNRGERRAVQFFKEWSGYEFSRVPQSGGLRWHKQKDIAGDIICTQSKRTCGVSIEVKNYAELNFQHLLIPDVNSKILKFWEQCKADAFRVGKQPLLLMRKNGMKAEQFFVIMELNTMIAITLNHKHLKTQANFFMYGDGKDHQLFIGTTDHLKQLSYGVFNKTCKELNAKRV